ncbi:hypothetical protein TUM20985_37470 [Mycobacterium antarcticum]|uniref:DUF1800 domain-containing protein n=1 Tax=Mycolicibacterium sp. TUM20985 TaxID=3023370 RepID=UPI0025748685|nr:DUF1800 domain-containing protein [Mycolicibacterium sp. TUM20985]BDX33200.1 hypothetical protein TUM20985_37470 [Mycolicibacterium sp. TUM20985]
MTQSPQWNATARLLRRTGFGTTGRAVDAVVSQDRSAYLDAVLDLDPDTDPGAAATPMPTVPMPTFPAPGASTAENDAFIAVSLAQTSELVSWWMRRIAAVEQPLHEKLTLLWHNHFAVSAEKVRVAELMAKQNATLRALKLGDFRTLAYAMLTDEAMNHWLDGIRNTKEAPNENLSREFMELFTLGHGNGYTEVDVREGARALTGRYVLRGGVTGIQPEHHDSTSKTVFGVTGTLNEADFCDIVLDQPASAPFIANKLWLLLASDDPPPRATLDRLVAAYGPKRNLRSLTKAILTDPEFDARAGTLVNTPVEWLLGTVRSLSVPVDSAQVLAELDAVLAVMGQRLFYPPDVNGWPRGLAWLSTAGTAARVWAANRLVALGDLSVVEDAAAGDRVDAAGYVIGIGEWSARTRTALADLVADPAKLVTAAINSPEYLTS